jgi:ADP-ribose pyrophosphatase
MKDERDFTDSIAPVKVSEPIRLAEAFCNIERYTLELEGADGSPIPQTRDIVRVGRVVGVLAIDLDRDEVVLIRQFRLAAHLATGKGDLVEIVAGHVNAHENPAAAARRECLEELGVMPTQMVEIFTFMPSPGLLDEHTTMYLASVDASQLPNHAGAANESEQTRPIRIGVNTALMFLSQGMTCNGYLIIALQWLALNRANLKRILRPGNGEHKLVSRQ